MSTWEEVQEYEDDEKYGVPQNLFFESMKMGKWAGLFDPFLLPDGQRICLAWMWDATAKKLSQLGIDNSSDVDLILKTIHEKLVELGFHFEQEDRRMSVKRRSTKGVIISPTISADETMTKTVRDMKVSPTYVAHIHVDHLEMTADSVDTGLTDEDALRRTCRWPHLPVLVHDRYDNR